MDNHTALPWSLVSARYIGATEFAGIANASVTELVADNLKKVDAEFIVTACNAHYQLAAFLADIDLIEHPDAGDHNPLCQEGTNNATVLDNIIARARELRAALTAAGAL